MKKKNYYHTIRGHPNPSYSFNTLLYLSFRTNDYSFYCSLLKKGQE